MKFPKQGDFVILSFDLQAGHEQQGRRPALVISKESFNKATGMAMVCPITNTNRGNPFHVPVPPSSTLSGVVMVDQVKSLDLVARRFQIIENAPEDFVEEVLSILDACLF